MTMISAGGMYDEGYGGMFRTAIMEYDMDEDSFLDVGNMTLGRAAHAISVVKFDDFSQWCY